MIITCEQCGGKLRVPDTAAGKRVKCPKCAAIVRLPAAETPGEAPETTGVSPKPLPPVPTVTPEGEDGTEVAAGKPTPHGDGTRTPPASTSARTNSFDHDDDDLDDLDMRGLRTQTVNSMAMTSMVLGVVSVTSLVAAICCCGLLGAGLIGAVTGALALILGFIGKVPGSEGYALTGIICGGIGTGLGLIEFIGGIALVGFQFGLMN